MRNRERRRRKERTVVGLIGHWFEERGGRGIGDLGRRERERGSRSTSNPFLKLLEFDPLPSVA